MGIYDIFQKYGVGYEEISLRFGIPRLEAQEWASGKKEPPGYVLRMIEELLERDRQDAGRMVFELN